MAEKKAKNKPMTDKQSYRVKNEYLAENYSEVTPMEFYREMFPLGSFERRGHLEDAKANGILTVIEGDKARNYVVFDDLREIVGHKASVHELDLWTVCQQRRLRTDALLGAGSICGIHGA